jgi:hypothetical protein
VENKRIARTASPPQEPGFRGETELCSQARLAFPSSRFRRTLCLMELGISGSRIRQRPTSRVPGFPKHRSLWNLGLWNSVSPTDFDSSRSQGHTVLWNLGLWNSWTLMGYGFSETSKEGRKLNPLNAIGTTEAGACDPHRVSKAVLLRLRTSPRGVRPDWSCARTDATSGRTDMNAMMTERHRNREHMGLSVSVSLIARTANSHGRTNQAFTLHGLRRCVKQRDVCPPGPPSRGFEGLPAETWRDSCDMRTDPVSQPTDS